MDFDFSIKTQADYNQFVQFLKSVSKNETIEDHERHVKILNTNQKVIAIAMALIRKTAHKIFKNGYEEFLKLSLENDFQNEFYEETLIQGLVIAEIQDFEIQKKYLDLWVHKIDNWSTCDSVVSTMKNLKIMNDKKIAFDYFYDLCFSKSEFVSRFGIVVLMTYFLDDDFIDEVLKMCEQVKSDAYYVGMAIAWLLSFAFMKFKEKTYKLFESKTLSKFVQNKAISKCRDSFQILKADKENLINYRIK